MDQDSGKAFISPPLNLANFDTIPGNYLFIISPGYAGHSLVLNANGEFTEKSWSCVYRPRHGQKGNWHLQKKLLVLKTTFHSFSFYNFQYSGFRFLVPINKLDQFQKTMQNQKARIDSLYPKLYQLKKSEIPEYLAPFKTLAYISWPGL